VILTTIASVFSPTDDADLELDRWRKVRVFVAAFLEEPALNAFNGCDMLDVEVLARALIAGVASEFWLHYVDCIQGVVLMWQFLLLMSDHMDASPALSRAVGALLFLPAVRTRGCWCSGRPRRDRMPGRPRMSGRTCPSRSTKRGW